MWEHAPLEFRYEITLSADEKILTKKIAMGKFTRHRIAVDESKIIYINNNNQAITTNNNNQPDYFFKIHFEDTFMF